MKHWTRPAALAELSYRRWRQRAEAACTPDPVPRAPAGILRAARQAALWAITVVITAASGASFAESYRGLWLWARHHGLAGFWAAAFPLQVDAFIVVGELVLLVAMIDRWTRRERAGAWLVALLGLAASVAGNTGHVAAHDIQSRATAAIPPVAAFAALWLGLSVLKRVLGRHAGQNAAGTMPRGSLATLPGPDPGTVPALAAHPVPADAESAALLALKATLAAGNPYSNNQLTAKFKLTRAQAAKLRQQAEADHTGQPGDETGTAAA